MSTKDIFNGHSHEKTPEGPGVSGLNGMENTIGPDSRLLPPEYDGLIVNANTTTRHKLSEKNKLRELFNLRKARY